VPVSDEELKARAQAIVGAQAAVALFGNPKFQALTNDLTNALGREDEETAIALLIKFTNLAKGDLAGTSPARRVIPATFVDAMRSSPY
jgi:hypothetical protein